MVEHERTGPVDTLTWAFSRIMMWAPALIVVIIFYEVVMRYIFFSPTRWVNETSLWVGGAIYVTSGLYSMQQRSHIRIFIIYDMVPVWMRKLFDTLSVICVCIFSIAVFWGGYGEAVAGFWRWEKMDSAWAPPIPAVNGPLVLTTLGVLALQAISNLIRDWPSAAWVRKLFDIIATISIVVLAIMAFPILLSGSEAGLETPWHWRTFFLILLAAAIAASIFGLVRDFNKTPSAFVESHDPADEVALPDEVLSGNPPGADITDDSKKN